MPGIEQKSRDRSTTFVLKGRAFALRRRNGQCVIMSFIFEALEPTARQRELLGSFSLLVAAAVFVIPYERMGSQKHPLHKAARDVDLFRALKSLRKKPFVAAPFWNEEPPNGWRFSRIMTNANDTAGWVDEEGQ